MSENYKNSYKATDKELVSLSVYNVGCQRCDPGYQWGPGIRDRSAGSRHYRHLRIPVLCPLPYKNSYNFHS